MTQKLSSATWVDLLRLQSLERPGFPKDLQQTPCQSINREIQIGRDTLCSSTGSVL